MILAIMFQFEFAHSLDQQRRAILYSRQQHGQPPSSIHNPTILSECLIFRIAQKKPFLDCSCRWFSSDCSNQQIVNGDLLRIRTRALGAFDRLLKVLQSRKAQIVLIRSMGTHRRCSSPPVILRWLLLIMLFLLNFLSITQSLARRASSIIFISLSLWEHYLILSYTAINSNCCFGKQQDAYDNAQYKV